jgi:hypothetical protein
VSFGERYRKRNVLIFKGGAVLDCLTVRNFGNHLSNGTTASHQKVEILGSAICINSEPHQKYRLVPPLTKFTVLCTADPYRQTRRTICTHNLTTVLHGPSTGCTSLYTKVKLAEMHVLLVKTEISELSNLVFLNITNIYYQKHFSKTNDYERCLITLR